MADKLTPQQYQAVTNRGGKLLVSAAAGSGKTKVLVDRLMRYLLDPDDPADLDEFLIITYTKAAASELRGKIAAKLTERIAQNPENRHLQKQMQRLFLTKISTVHGFCGDLLREYAYKLDLPADFRVADENECAEIRETVLSDLLDRAYQEDGQDPDFRTFVDTQGLGRDDRLIPEILLKVYDSSRCHLDPNGWLEECIQNAQAESAEDVSQTVWGNYLIEDLHDCLDAHIQVLEECVREADGCPGLEKAAANLRDTLFQIKQLRACTKWDDIVRNNAISFGRLTFPTKNNPDPGLTERIKAARGACKKALEKKLRSFTDPSEQILKDMKQCASGVRGMVALVRCFDKEYAQAKKRSRILDFGDLEHKTLELLLGKQRLGTTSAAREIGRRYREVMVDEYQDSNGVQDAIFSALTEEKQNCFLVGDVKQSIYQFRLADPGIFLKKYYDYIPAEEASEGAGRKVFLSHNFRSGGEIVEAVNHVFAFCMSDRVGGLQYGEAEALREGIPHTPLPEPAVTLYGIEAGQDAYAEEAAVVADQIQQMLKDGAAVRRDGELRPVTPEDIVILLRSPGSVGSHFQKALEARGIRCTSGGGNDLLETEEIATVCSFLQVIVNPRQDIPLISVLASPIFGFTADDLARIRCTNRKESYYDALLESRIPKAEAFLEILQTLRREARRKPLTALLETCYHLTRLDSVYAAMPGGDARRKNLQTFYQLAVDYEQGNLRDLNQFLDHLEALKGRGLTAAGTSSAGCVTIMSIHKSKGLEFPVVILAGLSRAFNRESLQAQILCDQELGIGLSVADSASRIRYPSIAKRAIMVKAARESLSEEMRVLYVAMTRARDRLVMTYAAKNLRADLSDIALRMDFDDGKLLCMEAGCPGEWVLLAAMSRMEAGLFHNLGGRPRQLSTSEFPWRISILQGQAETEASAAISEPIFAMPEKAELALQKALSFQYEHEAATRAPSKQTATDRKGRVKDAEAAELAAEQPKRERSWRRPSFLSDSVSGREYGNTIHSVMQYIRYENCGSEAAVIQEVNRLVQDGFLTEAQRALCDCGAIARFFESEIGRKLCGGIPCLREFKFSILDDGNNYGEGLEGEQVLLQGVVDCAILEEDGITILDFKTDRVTEKTLDAVTERYIPQVQTYADALGRIYEMPVKAKYLYFFRMNCFRKV